MFCVPERAASRLCEAELLDVMDFKMFITRMLKHSSFLSYHLQLLCDPINKAIDEPKPISHAFNRTSRQTGLAPVNEFVGKCIL